MLRKRVIVSLDIKDGRAIVLGPTGLRDLGEPVDVAERYAAAGADEIVFSDISDSAEGRRTLLEVVSQAAQRVFVPLAVGGGISEVADIALALRAGADKVAINTAGLKRPELIGEASVRFGKQCVVATIEARLEKRQIEIVTRTDGPPTTQGQAPAVSDDNWFRVFTHAGRTATELDAITWARQCVSMGAGEILVSSIDQNRHDGGYDLELTARIVEAVNVPVIASGDARSAGHMRDLFLLAGADGAIAGRIFHDGGATVGGVKQVLAAAGIAVREGVPAMPA